VTLRFAGCFPGMPHSAAGVGADEGPAMANQSVKHFLSCGTDAFGTHRDELRRKLTGPNVEVKIQGDFNALGGDTLNKLAEYVAACETIGHFIGDMAVYAPATTSVDDLLSRNPDLEGKLAAEGVT